MRSMTEPLRFLDDAHQGLVRHFGLTAFRPGQAEVIDSVLAGRNAVVVMPTGARQEPLLPAARRWCCRASPSWSRPLIALMKDQVDALTARGHPGHASINSTLDADERGRAHARRMREGRLQAASTSRRSGFRSPRFLDALARRRRRRCSRSTRPTASAQWGHDFRPDYARLGAGARAAPAARAPWRSPPPRRPRCATTSSARCG